MSANMVTPHTATRTRWQRFIDWLAGGPPDPEKLEAARLKPWYKKYLGSLICWGLWFGLIAYPHFVTVLNAQPDTSQIRTLDVRIVQTRDGKPHFVMELPEGRQLSVYWPVDVSFLGDRRFNGWTKEERQALVGCQASAQLSPIRMGVFSHQYRVWTLSCPQTGFRVGMEETQRELARDVNLSSWFFWIPALVFYFPVGFVFFLREKRGVL